MSVQHAGGMVSLFHMFILHRLLTWLGAQKGKTKAASMLCNMFRKLVQIISLLLHLLVVKSNFTLFASLAPEDVLPVVNGGCLITSALEEACGGQTGEK
ncbi:DNA ligase, ATP-dependent [Gossypium australe]|uniref:DNA ligase, ATP-dependent n=1 Tax=Gossypium australe TaxID=47621 RepID=A0A5B6W0N4_9ROSI|nr:DNA ligase, ATP-dependent [Gossypium australe]